MGPSLQAVPQGGDDPSELQLAQHQKDSVLLLLEALLLTIWQPREGRVGEVDVEGGRRLVPAYEDCSVILHDEDIVMARPAPYSPSLGCRVAPLEPSAVEFWWGVHHLLGDYRRHAHLLIDHQFPVLPCFFSVIHHFFTPHAVFPPFAQLCSSHSRHRFHASCGPPRWNGMMRWS